MNTVENLLETPFLSRTFDEKLRIKRLGPYQPENFSFVEGGDCLPKDFFRRAPWLTVSHEKKSLFCFYCLLFGGDYLWTKSGLKDHERLRCKIMQHGSSAIHIKNAVNYKTFGNLDSFRQLSIESDRIVLNHNDSVSRNRQVLNDMLDILKSCGHLDPPSRNRDGSHNPPKCEILLDILTEFSKSDSILEDYLSNEDVTPDTLRTIQSELLDCIYEVYAQNIAEEIEHANYVALQVDDVSDVSWRSQFSITLRYLINDTLIERFLCFVNASDAEKLATVLVQTLNSLNLKNKLVAQAYDGALLMEKSPGNPHVLMAESFPHAICLHSYAHGMYSVVKQACSRIRTIRLFFANVYAFSMFFSTSYKLYKILGENLYEEASVFLGNSADVEFEMINFIMDHKTELIKCFKGIQRESYWDDKTINKSLQLQNLLQEDEFLFLLKFFQSLLGPANMLYSSLQSEESSSTVVQYALQSFRDSVEKLKERFNAQPCIGSFGANCSFDIYSESDSESLQMVIREVCDIIIQEMLNRFKNYDLYYSFSILNPKKFEFYAHHFPEEYFETISNNYKMVDKDKLRSELEAIYNSQAFGHASTLDLPLLLKAYDLQVDFIEILKLLEIFLATPVPTTEGERCFCTLQHIRTFLKNSSPEDNVNALAALEVHRDYISNIEGFNQKVIEKFSLQEHRREMYCYRETHK